MIPRRRAVLLSFILFLSFFFKRFAESRVAQEEVDVLQQIFTTMGAKYWKFNADSCEVETVGVTRQQLSWSDISVECDCNNGDIDSCHIISIVLKGLSLPGVLPPQLSQLPYIKHIDIAYNYLSGTIPTEWASTKLNFISVLVNRLSGEIPKALGNITSLNYLNLEGNQFSGVIPSEIGNLINLKTLMLSSNRLVGSLPTSFSALVNLQDFRISDNNFSGPIPNFIQNWKQLTRLEMQASGLEGPIPRFLSLLENLTNLRISDINGPSQGFPLLRRSTGLITLILRNCNISGEIPSYIWNMKYLQLLDVSFNKLVGGFPDFISARSALKFLFLTGNILSGNIPKSILVDGINIDLSYNNFTWQGFDEPACQPDPNLHLNLYKSFSRKENSSVCRETCLS
ncbi:unnamed protein product [Cuscuta campestris]|uniref:Disease resistance R13L4/SHOC-2-like LRR domain-containing protein n=1 Tax=Cuscuta campestris TaxID=132261 RepID=A0A484MI40_9ASTE|nr:unnamed protein product [Cuscuta campestris]